MHTNRILILDGYTDEPAGFGVPPYIDVLPRYIAGLFWEHDKSVTIHYVTVDSVRKDIHSFVERAETYDTLIVIAGAVVPGRYLGGEPIQLNELKLWFRLIKKPIKILLGAAARWGIGNEGGTIARLPKEVEENFDVIVRGDPEAYIYEYIHEGLEKARPWITLRDFSIISKAAILGAKIVEQHPNYGYNLVAEIETYRSCSRWRTGGCSFCATKLYGIPIARKVEDIVKEIEALYTIGVRHFRLGRQADFLVYGSPELSTEEWPKPNPQEIERLLHGIRSVAPSLKTLHIDNVNPATIVKHTYESMHVLKTIVKYHTPGDVAALGVETADPRVIEENNLKTSLEESLESVRIINKIGSIRGYNGLPELLPGINFVLGLPGESTKTYKYNEELIDRIYNEGLLLRRINVRKVLILPGTKLYIYGKTPLNRYRGLAKSFQEKMMRYSRLFLKRLLPTGTILRDVYVEKYSPKLGITFARQAGSYPIVVEIPCKLNPPRIIDVFIYAYSGRSVRGLPLPLDANKASFTDLVRVVGERLARTIIANRPFKDNVQLVNTTKFPDILDYVSVQGLVCYT